MWNLNVVTFLFAPLPVSGWIYVLVLSQVPQFQSPPEFIYFTQKLICPALMPALNLTFFVAGPWKETKFLKLVRVRESNLLKYCLSLSFSLCLSFFPEKKC